MCQFENDKPKLAGLKNGLIHADNPVLRLRNRFQMMNESPQTPRAPLAINPPSTGNATPLM